jgi:hypothetical protein
VCKGPFWPHHHHSARGAKFQAPKGSLSKLQDNMWERWGDRDAIEIQNIESKSVPLYCTEPTSPDAKPWVQLGVQPPFYITNVGGDPRVKPGVWHLEMWAQGSEVTSLDWTISVFGKSQCSAIRLADEKSRIYWVWNVGKTVFATSKEY